MGLELVEATRPEGIDSGVMPDVGARTAVPPELDVVEVWLLANAKDADQLHMGGIAELIDGRDTGQLVAAINQNAGVAREGRRVTGHRNNARHA